MAPLHLRRLPGCDLPGVADADLVARFATERDEAAFELLAYRHGPMVWATCRRVLSDHHAAEDAFQAAFLVLARKAGSIRRTTSVAAWLHRVAVRAGLDLRRRRPIAAETLGSEPIDPCHGPVARAEAAELGRDFDAAVNDLPARLRQAFILCDLQGHPLAAAATILGCPRGTVESRLTRARQQLRKRFAAYALGGLAAARVPASVHAAVLRVVFDRGSAAPAVVALAQRVGGSTFGFALSGVATVFAAGLVAAFGLADPPKSGTKAAQVESPKEKEEVLPAGVIARLGSDRFRHGGTPMAVPVFSGDGKLLAVPDTMGVYVFDTASGKRGLRLALSEKQLPRVVRFLADGKHIAVGSSDFNSVAELTLFALADGAPGRRTRFAGKGQIFVIDVRADGERVLVEDRSAKSYLWDPSAGREVWAIDNPEAAFTLGFTADGKSFALASSKKAELRDAATGKVTAEFPRPGPPFRSLYEGATLAPDGRLTLATVDGDVVGLLSSRGPDPVRTWKSDGQSERMTVSPDGKFLIGCGPVGTRVWDTTSPSTDAVARLPAATFAAVSPDGRTLALSDFGVVTLWSTADWKPLPQSAAPASAVRGVRFTADGAGVVGHSRQGWAQWRVAGGPEVRLSDDAPTEPEGHSDISADGRTAVDVLWVPGPDRPLDKFSLRLTDLTSGKDRRFPLNGEPWAPIRIGPDGRFVSASLRGKEFVVWDAATGAVLHRSFPRATDNRILFGAHLAVDGKSVARSVTGVFRKGAGPGDAMYDAVYLTDHHSGKDWKLDPVPWSVYTGGAWFNRDGTRVIVRASYGIPNESDRATVLDTETGRRLCDAPFRSGYTHTAALSFDGRALATGENLGTLTVTEVATGRPRISFRHAGVILSAAFHPDGTKLVASSAEAPIYVWDLIGKPGPWDATKADAVWADLASADAKVAFAAIRLLRANPAAAVEFLRSRVKVEAVPADATVADLLKQLDAKEFASRERAERVLIGVADLLKPRLEAERQRTTSAEVRERLDRVLKSTDAMTADRLRAIRVCEVLEGIGGAEAVRTLKTWSAGPAGARLTTEAAESLRRLSP